MARTSSPRSRSNLSAPRNGKVAARPLAPPAYHAAVKPIRSALLPLLQSRSHLAGRIVALFQAWSLLGEWLDAAGHVVATRHHPTLAAADFERLRRWHASLGGNMLVLMGIDRAPAFAAIAAAEFPAAWGQAEAMRRELDGLGYSPAPIPATRSNTPMPPSFTLPLPGGLSNYTGTLTLYAASASAAELRPALHVAGATLHVATVCAALARALEPDMASHSQTGDRANDAMVAIYHLARRALAVGIDWRSLVEGGVRHGGQVLAAACPTLDHDKACAGTMELLDRCLDGELPGPAAITRANSPMAALQAPGGMSGACPPSQPVTTLRKQLR